MVSQLQNVSSVDLYYICQMVDNITRNPEKYLRHVEDLFGDTASISLTNKYPKITCFHVFAEEIISSVIWEKAGSRLETMEHGLWVDNLLEANGYKTNFDVWRNDNPDGWFISDYLDGISEDGLISVLCEDVAKQVFHVLFSNRGTLSAFGQMVSWYVTEVAPSFAPEKFNANNHLLRETIPMWCKNAVFHRDKGRCVLCKTDLTRLVNNEENQHFDHIIPLALGGMNCVTNLQLTCSTCNIKKGARSTDTSKEYQVWYDY